MDASSAHRLRIALLLMLLTAPLSACATPTQAVALTSEPTATQQVATPVLSVPTMVPTFTPLPPTPEPTVAPTAAAPPPPGPTVIPASEREQIFADVWNTINDNYLYSDFRGTDWAAVRAEFAPRIAAAESNESFFTLLEEMVRRLGDNHSRFLPPRAADREDVLTSGREEQVGIGVITMNFSDGAFIQHVFPGSPAEEAGLLPRDRIVGIDGMFYSRASIEGPEGSQVRLTVVRPGEEGRDFILTRRKVEGLITPTVRRIEGDLAYVAVTTLWVNDMAEQTGAKLTDLLREGPVRGVILDLRGNPGGWRHVLTGLLGLFVQGEVGSFFNRREALPLIVEAGPGPDLRGLPVVVLTDDGTASYAELLAGILQREAQAHVIGVPTAGNTETIYGYELAGGSRLWVAQEGFRLRDETNLEGLGVQPDTLLTLDWTRYSESQDPMILQAQQIIQAQQGS